MDEVTSLSSTFSEYIGGNEYIRKAVPSMHGQLAEKIGIVDLHPGMMCFDLEHNTFRFGFVLSTTQRQTQNHEILARISYLAFKPYSIDLDSKKG